MTENRGAEQEVTLLRREEKPGEHEKNVHGEVQLIDRGLLMGDPLFLEFLNSGDVLTVWKMDRLERSLRDLIMLMDELQGRDIGFCSLTESIDTTTATGRAMWQMVGVLAELERSLIKERTKAGRTAAMKRGVKMGRKPALSPEQKHHACELIEQGKPAKEVAKLLGVGLATIYRVLSPVP